MGTASWPGFSSCRQAAESLQETQTHKSEHEMNSQIEYARNGSTFETLGMCSKPAQSFPTHTRMCLTIMGNGARDCSCVFLFLCGNACRESTRGASVSKVEDKPKHTRVSDGIIWEPTVAKHEHHRTWG